MTADRRQQEASTEPMVQTRTAFIGAGLLVALTTIALALFMRLIIEVDPKIEITLSLVLLVGVVVFIAALTVMAAAYRSLGLARAAHALGLPEGSVRAILALMLVFLFFVAVLFLFGTLSNSDERTLVNVPQARYNELLTTTRIVSASAEGTPAAGTPPTYTVTVRNDISPAAQDMAKQLVTLLGTLVTAVAAFYFGANVAISARQGYPQPPATPAAPAGTQSPTPPAGQAGVAQAAPAPPGQPTAQPAISAEPAPPEAPPPAPET